MKTFVLFGSTGDLATRYVLPALGTLLKKGVFQRLICVGRRDWTRDDFRNFLAPYPDLLNSTEVISYVRLDIDESSYSSLRDELESYHGDNLSGDIIYHFCLSPEYFVTVARGLSASGLNTTHSRVMIEKPFGHDLRSAISLNLNLENIFHEDQIYRVDHYLGKNFVQNFYEYRMENGDDWYANKIREIRIVAREMVTVEGRGVYYDKSGAIRDVIQNHLLQILAIAIMEKPRTTENDAIRDRIAQAITNVAPLLVDPRHDILLGQYRGYLEEYGVDPHSRTETYVKAHLTIDSPLWRGTDVILETGKALDKKESSITLIFQNGEQKIFEENNDNKNNAYEALIEKAFDRDERYFVRWDSVRAAWQVVDELLHCTDNCPLLQKYSIGSGDIISS